MNMPDILYISVFQPGFHGT